MVAHLADFLRKAPKVHERNALLRTPYHLPAVQLLCTLLHYSPDSVEGSKEAVKRLAAEQAGAGRGAPRDVFVKDTAMGCGVVDLLLDCVENGDPLTEVPPCPKPLTVVYRHALNPKPLTEVYRHAGPWKPMPCHAELGLAMCMCATCGGKVGLLGFSPSS